jgi:hypothetical protein
VSSIRAGLRRILEDHSYRNRLVETGFANVERFRVQNVASRYADLYRRVAQAAPAAAPGG